MKFSIKQKNNLITGVQLEAELTPTSLKYRKFLSIRGYSYNTSGKFTSLSNILNKRDTIYFSLRCYEIPREYIDNDWDVDDSLLVNEIWMHDIKDINALEEKLREFISDLSILKPSWETAAPL